MDISGDRITYLADKMTKALLDEEEIGSDAGFGEIKSAVIRAFRKEQRKEEKIRDRVRSKIESLERHIQEGSKEWEDLYQEYYEEEISKRTKLRQIWEQKE